MTIAPEELRVEQRAPAPDDPARVEAQGVEASREQPPPRARIAIAAGLASLGGAWVVGGMLDAAVFARALGALGITIGIGIVSLSFRTTRTALVQYAVLPVAAIAGAVLVAPDARGGTANIFGLIGEALHSGGLRQPPIPFDPGWRFVLVVLFAITAAAALALSDSLRRPRLAVLIPLPLTMGAALLQPKGAEVLSGTVGVILSIASLGVAHGVEIAGTGGARSFEMRRLARAGAMLAGLTALLLALSTTNLLFPDTNRDRVIPPQRPPASPPEPDRELFTVRSDRPGPWRVGVLDVYDGRGWLLPPFDRARDQVMEAGRVLGAVEPPSTYTVAVRVSDLRGLSLPVPAGLVAVKASSLLNWDPRIGVPHLDRRIPQGLSYTAVAAAPPTGAQLDEALPPAPQMTRRFVDGDGTLPPPPAAIRALLQKAPPQPFDRLQYLRDRLYAAVVAAGGGSPIDVRAERVAAMFRSGAEASPFEIVAAEALLARWAGVPSRIGYGYYGGDAITGGFSVHPRHAAVWLEAHFTGHGWVPLVGTPTRAKPSDSSRIKNLDPRVRPSDELALTVFIPMRERSLVQLFEQVRYAIMIASPFALALALGIMLWPAAAKSVRSRKRRRWGAQHAPAGLILVAYAELRDLCLDLNIGDVREPPLTFLRHFKLDEEFDELSWLVTRALWGDLRRDLRVEDVQACEELVASVRRRLLAEQTPVDRILARASRASLREPFSTDLPNVRARVRLLSRARAAGRLVRHRRTRVIASCVVLILLAGACGTGGAAPRALAAQRFPDRLVPETLLGYRFAREPVAEKRYRVAGADSLVRAGVVYTVREKATIQASFQAAVLDPELDTATRDGRRRIEESIGGTFTDLRVGTARVRVSEEDERTLFLWFPPERNVMQLLVARKRFSEGPLLMRAIIAYQFALPPELVARRPAVEPGQSGVTPAPGRSPGQTPEECSTSTVAAIPSRRPAATPGLTLVPAGTVAEGVAVETRLSVPNETGSARAFDVAVFWDREDAAHRIAEQRIIVQPGTRGSVRAWWPTAGRAGAHRITFRIDGRGRGDQPIVVKASGARALRKLHAVWLDPLGLSQGVYLRDCPVRQADLRASVDAMRAAEIDTIILTYAEYQGHFFYPSGLSFYDRDIKGIARGQLFDFDVIGTVIDQAARNGMRVIVGLGRGGDTELMGSMITRADGWERRTREAIDLGRRVAGELWRRYGGYSSFYGWYLTHESSHLPRAAAYYDPMADALHALSPDRPVMIAPTGNPVVDHETIAASHVDVFAYQDAVGAGYDGDSYTYDPDVRIRQLVDLYKKYRAIHEDSGKHLWSDLELWEMDGTQGYSGAYPADFDRVRRQIEIESGSVEVITGYEWAGFLQQSDARSTLGDTRARALYRAYLGYVRSGS